VKAVVHVSQLQLGHILQRKQPAGTLTRPNRRPMSASSSGSGSGGSGAAAAAGNSSGHGANNGNGHESSALVVQPRGASAATNVASAGEAASTAAGGAPPIVARGSGRSGNGAAPGTSYAKNHLQVLQRQSAELREKVRFRARRVGRPQVAAVLSC
jgi:hypothetical protein